MAEGHRKHHGEGWSPFAGGAGGDGGAGGAGGDDGDGGDGRQVNTHQDISRVTVQCVWFLTPTWTVPDKAAPQHGGHNKMHTSRERES